MLASFLFLAKACNIWFKIRLFFYTVISFYLHFLQQISARFSGNAVKIQNPRLWFTSQDSQTLVMLAWKDNFVLEERAYLPYTNSIPLVRTSLKVLKGPLLDLVK